MILSSKRHDFKHIKGNEKNTPPPSIFGCAPGGVILVRGVRVNKKNTFLFVYFL